MQQKHKYATHNLIKVALHRDIFLTNLNILLFQQFQQLSLRFMKL